MALPLCVLHGVEPGPTAWISAAVHGDEINGTETIRRLINELDPQHLKGTLLAVPVVDVYGFNRGSRYLPDRRDLNRVFPGNRRGPLATRLAHVFTTSVVGRCQFGIDLHTGSSLRSNFPQVRGDLNDGHFMTMARAFAAPIIVASKPIRGSLRAFCTRGGIDYLIYEGGEAGRFESRAIQVSFEGAKRVLAARGMIEQDKKHIGCSKIITAARWLRAPRSGIFTTELSLGALFEAGVEIGNVSNTFKQDVVQIKSKASGVVIGLSLNPLVEEGDAIVHIGMPES